MHHLLKKDARGSMLTHVMDMKMIAVTLCLSLMNKVNIEKIT